MEISQFAPVFVPTLNRYEHFKRCVESLARCTHAKKTDLFIALDYPLKDSHWEGYNKIKKYLVTINGFKSVNVIERKENFGSAKNYIEGQKEIFEKYDRLIFSEDDNEFSPNFLDYINKGLDKFEDNPNIIFISGYIQPITIPTKYAGNYCFQRRLAAWGFGAWKGKSYKIYYTNDEIKMCLKSWKNALKLYKRSQKHLDNLVRSAIEGRDLYGDMAIGIYFAINNKLRSINPTVSKVRNYGHDGSGMHCGNMNEDIYKSQIIDQEEKFYFIEPKQNNILVQREVDKYFRLKLKQKIILLLNYLFFKLKIN